MKIYKIIDKENGDEQVGDFFRYRGQAESLLRSKLRAHCWRVANKINKLTGIKRGKDARTFEEMVDSISKPRYTIVEVRVNQ